MASTDAAPEAPPFSALTALEPRGDGRFTAELGEMFTIGAKAHGGLMMVLLTKAAVARLGAEQAAAHGGTPELEPVAVSTEFLRSPELDTVELTTEVLKLGRQASVAAVRMTQGGRTVLSATVTAGRLPDGDPRYVAPSPMPLEPPPDAVNAAARDKNRRTGLWATIDGRFDPATLAFVRKETAEPTVRGWLRPHGEEPDPYLALLAGDALPPTVFNLGSDLGWAPTVQLTALLRARPAPGWLALESRASMVAGTWFDEDCTVRDSTGRVVCQARQLALAPLPR